jgi:hypothetical protein
MTSLQEIEDDLGILRAQMLLAVGKAYKGTSRMGVLSCTSLAQRFRA